MKKISLFVSMIMLALSLCIPVCVNAEYTSETPDYSAWSATELTGVTNATQWAPSGTYDNFVLEYTIQTSNWTSGTWMWYNFRQQSPVANNVRYGANNGVLMGEGIWGQSDFTTGSSEVGNVSDNAVHKMRIYANGKDITVEEYVNGKWELAVAFEQTKYDASRGGGAIKFTTTSPISFTITDAKVYSRYDSEVPDYDAWTTTKLTGVTNATQWAPSGTYDNFVLEYTIQTSNWTSNNGWMWYQFRQTTPAVNNVRYGSRPLDARLLGEPVWASNQFPAEGDTKIGNVSDNEAHKMRVAAIGKDITVEEYVNGRWELALAFEQTNYNATLGGGTIKFSSTPAFTITDAKIYVPYESEVPDYSDWKATELATTITTNDSNTMWAPSGIYDNFVLEYTISVTASADTTNYLWYNFRQTTPVANNVRYVTVLPGGKMSVEPSWGVTSGWKSADEDRGVVTADGAKHKMRVYANGADWIIEENINGNWAHVASFSQLSYTPGTKGSIKFSSNKTTTFTIENATIYEEKVSVTVEAENIGAFEGKDNTTATAFIADLEDVTGTLSVSITPAEGEAVEKTTDTVFTNATVKLGIIVNNLLDAMATAVVTVE